MATVSMPEKIAVLCLQYKDEGLLAARQTGMQFETLRSVGVPLCSTNVEFGFEGDSDVTHLIVAGANESALSKIVFQSIEAGIEVVVLASGDLPTKEFRDAYVAVVEPGNSRDIVECLTITTRECRLRTAAYAIERDIDTLYRNGTSVTSVVLLRTEADRLRKMANDAANWTARRRKFVAQ